MRTWSPCGGHHSANHRRVRWSNIDLFCNAVAAFLPSSAHGAEGIVDLYLDVGWRWEVG